jgi:acyl-coenzyme A synthetase/AMP-(fatty) acid ligase
MATMIVEEATGGDALSKLQVLMVGGEALSVSLARTLRGLAPQARLMNMYGPTETTIWSTTCTLDEIDDWVPLGEPIANTTLRIVGPDGRVRPTLVAGELLIGGSGLADGYWAQPALTRERFVDAGTRMYRTGDLVRRRAGGELEFLGRFDHQVKVRGHRIELGEVEAMLCEHPAIKQAAVVSCTKAAGEVVLAAYVTTKGPEPPDEQALRQHLASRLPSVMIPTTFTPLSAMPLTPTGKVDRAALPAPNARAVLTEASLVGLEKTIAEIWSELLGRDRIGPTQNFFDLGGHSLLAVQLQRKLREKVPKGHQITITDIFQFPTIRAQAGFLGGGVQGEEPARRGALRGQARLAARQRVTE